MPAQPQSFREHGSAIVVCAAVVVVLIGVRLAAPMLVPLALAAFLITATAPVTALCVRRGLSPGLAATAGVAVNLLLFALIALLLGFASVEMQHEVGRYLASAQDGLISIRAFLVSHHLPADRAVDSVNEYLQTALQQGLFGAAASVETFVVVLLIVFFGLAESASIGDKLRSIFPGTKREYPAADRLVREVQGYLLVKLLTSGMAATFAFIILRVEHVGLALPLALVMFVMHFIPNVGPLLALIPAVLVAGVDRGGVGMLVVGGGYLTASIVIGQLIEPRILGRTLGLSPFAVVLSLLLWGFLWGPIGALLAVPLTNVMKLVLENSTYARWGLLLEDPEHLTEMKPDDRRSLQVKIPWRHRTGSPLGLGSGETQRLKAVRDPNAPLT